MDAFINFLVESVPQMLAGIVVGLVILVIEYRTGWFARQVSSSASENHRRYPSNYRFRVLISQINSLIGLLFLLFLFGAMLYAIDQSSRPNTNLSDPSAPGVQLKTISEGQTHSFFDNALFVSVVDADESSASFVVGAPDYENTTVTDVSVGTRSVFVLNGARYEVRLSSVGLIFTRGAADFTVTKLEEPSASSTPSLTPSPEP